MLALSKTEDLEWAGRAVTAGDCGAAGLLETDLCEADEAEKHLRLKNCMQHHDSHRNCCGLLLTDRRGSGATRSYWKTSAKPFQARLATPLLSTKLDD
jgi:hypothetical protein